MKIIIIDDHSLFAQGLSKIIQEWFVDSTIKYFPSIKSFKESFISKIDIDLIISDIELPGENVFDFFEEYNELPILVISMHDKLHVIRKCQELNVNGYILKDDSDKFEQAINIVVSNGIYYSPKIKKKIELLEYEGNELTPKEESIIRLIAKGKSNSEIADELFVSINTIKTHRKNINSKLNIKSTGELIKYYYDNYIV